MKNVLFTLVIFYYLCLTALAQADIRAHEIVYEHNGT